MLLLHAHWWRPRGVTISVRIESSRRPPNTSRGSTPLPTFLFASLPSRKKIAPPVTGARLIERRRHARPAQRHRSALAATYPLPARWVVPRHVMTDSSEVAKAGINSNVGRIECEFESASLRQEWVAFAACGWRFWLPARRW